jgi:hypothetical protein
MLDLLEVAWSHLYPWPLALIVLVVGVGYFAQSLGFGMPPKQPYEIARRSLIINGTKYGGPVALSNLVVEESKVVDLTKEKELRPRLRTMGIGARGYKSGWFKLQDGRRALVHVTDPTRVLYIPTLSDYVLLLSVNDPGQFLSALKEGNATKFERRMA